MRIHLASVLVDDQQKALRFYTETLGFQLKHNIPLGRARLDHCRIRGSSGGDGVGARA